MDPLITALLAQLTDLTLKHSAATVAERIKTTKAAKSDKETISVLEEIINELINERNELQRISNALKESATLSKSISLQKLSLNQTSNTSTKTSSISLSTS